MKIRALLAGVAIAGAMTPATIALASTGVILPSAQYQSLQIYGGGGSASQTTTGSFSGSQLQAYPEATGIGTASTSTTMLPEPIITASASLNVTSGFEGYLAGPSSAATYYYWAAVVGPNNVDVPVDLIYTETITLAGPLAVGNAEAQGQLGIFANIPPEFYDIPEIPGHDVEGYIGTTSVSGSISYLSTANTPFVIGGVVTADLGGYTGSATDVLDPILTIDPSFAATDPNYPSDYSIELSYGVGNTISAAPEPSTWAMMLIGFGGLGATLRGSRRRLGAATA
jgi:hypothetical protein